MNVWAKLLNRALWFVFFCLGFYIVFVGGQRFWTADMAVIIKNGGDTVRDAFLENVVRCLYPGMFLEEEREEADTWYEWYIERVLAMHPLYRLQNGAVPMDALESTATYEMLVTGGVHDENETDENGQAYDVEALAEAENEQAVEEEAARQQEELQQQAELAGQETEAAAAEPVAAGTIYNLEELADFDFLFSHFYTMESNTTVTPDQLNAEKLLGKDMSINMDADGPQILIYHTHSQEGFVDSVPGDNSTTIVGVGEYLAELLREKGYNVMHVTSVYDLVDGKLDRNEAYSKAEDEISAILAETPSIQAVIDLHRDGVAEGTHLVTEINGKPTARLMFFNGLSMSKKNGPIDYLYNPYIEDNLALTLQLKLFCEQYYPGFTRNIYLKSLRYNLHLSDKALLIEAGAQTNTLQEMLNAMEPLADVLDKVFNP